MKWLQKPFSFLLKVERFNQTLSFGPAVLPYSAQPTDNSLILAKG